METVYIAGHKSPDLDSVIGAIAYAHFKGTVDPATTYTPVVAGPLNLETKYVLEQYNLPTPELMESVADKAVILVDHNEENQAIDGLKEARIREVIDHHKMNFSYGDPIRIIIEPIGSSSSIIAKMCKADNVAIPPELAAAMLAAVLVDTVITKSPTSTDEDQMIIEELAATAGIDDWQAFGMEIFKVRSSVAELSEKEIINADYKDFDINGKKFGVGQVETADMSELETRTDALLEALHKQKQEGSYASVVLFLTDIINEESRFLLASDDAEGIASAFGQKLENNMFTAPVISRKKQVIPTLLSM